MVWMGGDELLLANKTVFSYLLAQARTASAGACY